MRPSQNVKHCGAGNLTRDQPQPQQQIRCPSEVGAAGKRARKMLAELHESPGHVCHPDTYLALALEHCVC